MQNAVKKTLENAGLTEAQLSKALTANSLEELRAIAREEGVEASDTDLYLLWNKLVSQKAEGELSDDELDQVAGGKEENGSGDKYIAISNNTCPDCGNSLVPYNGNGLKCNTCSSTFELHDGNDRNCSAQGTASCILRAGY